MEETILYHLVCIAVLAVLYSGQQHPTRKDMLGSFEAIYLTISLVIATDCLWSILSQWSTPAPAVAYAINILYFIFAMLGVFSWFLFSIQTLHSRLYQNKFLLVLTMLPAIAICFLTATTPYTGLIFVIRDGEYMRGNLFFLDATTKLCYLCYSVCLSILHARRETRRYLKKKTLLLGVYCIPVIVCGFIQALTGIDLNCVGPIIGLTIVYKCGLSNRSKEDRDFFRAITQAYSAAYAIEIESGEISLLFRDKDPIGDPHNPSEVCSYKTFFSEKILNVVLPEDRILVEKGFELSNILRKLDIKNTYSILYKLPDASGNIVYNKATFMKAFDKEDRQKLFLGIEQVDTRQILLQEKADLEEEKKTLERIKESFTNVIAEVVDSRDTDSGEHLMRVKNYTQCIAEQVMADCPQYGLTPLQVRTITSASALHDIGKIRIPDAVLLKPGKLTPEEYATMQQHCVLGCELINKLPRDLDEDFIRYALEICHWHHEKYDGSGYPDRKKGDEIPVSAQIVALADCFDALTSKRVYKEALSKEEALDMILTGKCGVFSPELLLCLKKVCEELL